MWYGSFGFRDHDDPNWIGHVTLYIDGTPPEAKNIRVLKMQWMRTKHEWPKGIDIRAVDAAVHQRQMNNMLLQEPGKKHGCCGGGQPAPEVIRWPRRIGPWLGPRWLGYPAFLRRRNRDWTLRHSPNSCGCLLRLKELVPYLRRIRSILFGRPLLERA